MIMSSNIKILLAGFYDHQIERYQALFPHVTFIPTDGKTNLDAGAHVLIGASRGAFDAVFTPPVLKQLPALRWAHAPGAGIEAYLFPELATYPFVLTNGKIIQGPEVSEHAVALMLSLTRRIAFVAKGQAAKTIPRPVELRGKKACVIGLGGIGLILAEKLAGFGLHINGVTETHVPLMSFLDRIFLADQIVQAVSGCDVVLMAAPLTPVSRKMMNANAFAAMNEHSYFINVSRGGTVDTQALVAALQSGKLAGAGLDVTDPEPLPEDHILNSFPNVMVTPHLAGISDALADRQFELIATNIRRFAAGMSLINVVDKTLNF
jgi:D-2-hydroxyacid dehydrogenase (NADP+)